ncbi:MAG TPA: hypothetical protein VFH51_09295, partial [Myxococcota bacterium]|nr:hypothetical protein [Myxococcota bacterium]
GMTPPPRLSRRMASLTEAEINAAVERVWSHILALHQANGSAGRGADAAYAHRRLPAAHVARSLQDELRKMPERNRLDFSIALGLTVARRLGATDAKRLFAREIFPLLKKALTFSRTEHREMRAFRLQIERERGAYAQTVLSPEEQVDLLSRYVETNLACILFGWVLVKALRSVPSDAPEAVRADAVARARSTCGTILDESWAAFDRREFCGWESDARAIPSFS